MIEADLRNQQDARDRQVVPLLEKSCAAEWGEACCVLSFLHDEGKRVPKNPRRARKLNPALRIIARAHSEEEAADLRRWGADITVLAEEVTAARMAGKAAP